MLLSTSCILAIELYEKDLDSCINTFSSMRDDDIGLVGHIWHVKFSFICAWFGLCRDTSDLFMGSIFCTSQAIWKNGKKNKWKQWKTVILMLCYTTQPPLYHYCCCCSSESLVQGCQTSFWWFSCLYPFLLFCFEVDLYDTQLVLCLCVLVQEITTAGVENRYKSVSRRGPWLFASRGDSRRRSKWI